MDSEDECGRTLVQVISEKYSPDNFPYCRGPGVGVVIRTSPQGSPVKDRLNLPSVLVLDGCGITHAGDEEEVATFCSHVVELDLSNNQFKDWGEISKILSNIPHLDFLNLSMNPLQGSSLDSVSAENFSGLRRLVLNNTHVPWDMVHILTQEIPELEELFLCLNEYERVSLSPVACSSLRLLHITDNQLQHWGEVRKLGLLYPGLASLILANNSLSSIHEPEDALQRLFPNLTSINLHNSGLNSWEDIEKLNSFPKLQEVRLMGIPLLQPYTDQERRYLIVANLPSVSVLNGSVVTDGEREDAERFSEDRLGSEAAPYFRGDKRNNFPTKTKNQSQTPDKAFPAVPATCPHKQTQRRVTFHLPDGSQESCSATAGLQGEQEAGGSSTTQPLPLGFPQDEYYEQTSPNSRTEGDGNSDPESTTEVNLQKAMAEASETCTQECLILGHSDSCWMPPAVTQFQTSGTATLPSFSFQQSWAARGAKADGRHTLGRSVPKDDLDKGGNRPQFYNTLDRHCSKKEDPVKVIPLASFSATSSPQSSATGGSSAFLHEHQL